ncbi:AcrR family transcriptional regulator [Kineococcus xinjiangensis]|uniref:AcrR family transcriptional regulator n=1 Tax=Kineococcus xinjiangensis TaxID=512762 RepID=A0A2S6IWP1_9ACTN|nr:TetR family transcriptional regulator [Kineococcus xinjiangensis]PPK98705.1 AcrR family transcriptional regulator [Kineococcus xinjiangensis]
MVGRRSGRRPGDPSRTREQILTAAREAFAEGGYDATSMRRIAATAGVDPALLHHHFGSKERLFLAAVRAPADPAELMPAVAAGGPDGAGERLVTTFLGVWDSPAGAGAAALLRTAAANPLVARLVREFLLARVLRPLLADLGVPATERDVRASLVASQLMGLAVTRYVIGLEPLASAPAAAVVAAVGPTLQRYLAGDLGAALSDPQAERDGPAGHQPAGSGRPSS